MPYTGHTVYIWLGKQTETIVTDSPFCLVQPSVHQDTFRRFTVLHQTKAAFGNNKKSFTAQRIVTCSSPREYPSPGCAASSDGPLSVWT